ncbi:MAG: hypothetical protein ACRDM8_04470 [Gaiellaceae bacterium]
MTADELFAEIASIRERADPETRAALAKFERNLKAFVAESVTRQEEQVTRASPSDLAKSFRAVIDEFHAEAREAEDVAVAIKALDLEIKGLVEVEEKQTTLVLPSAGAALDPSGLSTLRVSFATVPVVPAEAPPEETPEPRARRRRTRS